MKSLKFNRYGFLLIPLIIIMLAGCSASRKPLYISPSFPQVKIDKIMLYPVVDLRVTKKGELKGLDKWVHRQFKKPLKRKHYHYTAISDRSLVLNITEDDISKPDSSWLFPLGSGDARWLLIPVLHDVSSKLTFGGTGNAEFSAALYDRMNGTVIWRDKVAVKVGQGGLLGMAMVGLMAESAIEEAALKVISTLPKNK